MISGFRAFILALTVVGAAAEPAPRAPVGGGRFYPADPKELAALVDGQLKAAGLPRVPGRVVAVVAPHAGLIYSGALAAKALAAARGLDPEVVVVLGTGHTKPVDGAALYPGDYGPSFPYDAELGRALLSATKWIVADRGAHKKEHSIEVLLPYISRVAPDAKLVALVMNTQSFEPAREVGRALAKALQGRRALIVVSSDLSHYPPAATAAIVDGATLDALSRMDPSFFWLTNRLLLTRGVKTLAVAWCGEGAMTAGLEAAKRLGARSAHVLARADSGDTVGDKTRVVGYAAVALTDAPPEPVPWTEEEKKAMEAGAREAIAKYLKSGKAVPAALAPLARLNVPASVTVTLKDASGKVRGSAGGTKAELPLHEAVYKAAVDAAISDARFKPVTAGELPKLEIDVSVDR